MSHYKLQFTPAKGDTESKTNFIVSTASAVSGSDSDHCINCPNSELSGEIKNINITFLLEEVTFDRQLYSPCQATAVINVTPVQDAGQSPELDLEDISKIFLGKTVEISCSAKVEGFGEYSSEIGRDYFVYNVKPGFVNSAKGMKCKVELTIYSRDFWLKTLKYSRSYLSQKLGEDIIKKNLSEGGLLEKYKVDCEISTKRLRNTTYQPGSGGDAKELIQPYHIQYNEDFYTFLSRVAIRHGEYLFFEDGKLTLGLDNETQAVSLEPVNGTGSKYNIVSEMFLQASSKNPLETNTYYNNYNYHTIDGGIDIWGTQGRYTVSNQAAGEPVKIDSKKLYFNEDAFDEHFDVCSLNSDSFPSSVMQQEPLGEIGIKWLFTELCPMIAEFKNRGAFFGGYALLRNVILDMVMIQVRAVRANNDFNDKYKEAVDISLAKEKEQKNGDLVNQFATLTQEETTNASNFMHAYYTAVREGEQAVRESVVTFCVAPAVCGNVKLGAKIIYKNTEYFVTRIYGKKTVGSVDNTYIEAVPVMKVVERTDLTEDQKKENVWKSKVKMLPPYNACYEHPLAMPQVAVVVDSNDPRYLNRVRVKYPWQGDSEPASVWMRVQTPFSTANGAFHFQPTKGDEVMINYEAGNIDRPFVSGFLFNSQNMPSMFPYYASREIRTENGSRIVLGKNSGNIGSYLDSILPISSFVTPFLGPELKSLTSTISGISPAAAKLFGNVTLTDGFGMFEISGDTAMRQVHLSSTAGKVVIDALTGVDVMASLGDIKIKAKNISIEADNRINIISGLSIKDAMDKESQIARRDRLLKDKGKGAATLAAFGDYGSQFVCDILQGKMDLSIIRSVWEAIYPPMDGTLKLKSYRYMQIEAGSGNAMDAEGGFLTSRPYGDSKFVRVDNICKHLVMKSLRARLKKMKSIAQTYLTISELYNSYPFLRTFNEVIDKAIENDADVNSDFFVTKTDKELEDFYSDPLNPHVLMSVMDNKKEGIRCGKELVLAIRTVKAMCNNSTNSTKFNAFIEEEKPKIAVGADGVENILKTSWTDVVNSYDLKNIVKDYVKTNKHHSFLDEMYKRLFREVVYSILAKYDANAGAIKYFPVYAEHIAAVADKKNISDAEWKNILDSINKFDENLVDDNYEKREGVIVSRDPFRKLVDSYYHQFNSPSSIWGENQEGHLLISDSEAKTFKLVGEELKPKDNVTTIATAKKFLFKK